jgi:hypothetical protein
MTGKVYDRSLSFSVIVIYLLTLISLSFGSVQSAMARTEGRGSSFGGSSTQSFSGDRSSGGYRSSGGEHAFNRVPNQRNTSVIHSQPRVMNQRNERTYTDTTNQRSVPSISRQTVNKNPVNKHQFNGVTTQRSITGTSPRAGIRNESRGSISTGVGNNRRFEGNRITGYRDRDGGFSHRGVFDRDRGFRFHHQDRFPRGSVFWSVPFGAEVFLFGGLTYFWWDDIWYRSLEDRYVVVDSPYDEEIVDQAPVIAPSTIGDGEQMVITEELLNVRSGPGLDYPEVYVLHSGDIVTVHGYDSDWLYITNSKDENGWIMSEYASPVSDDASG